MKKVILFLAAWAASAVGLAALGADDETSGQTEGEAEYVVREEKVFDLETGKVEVEKVIEFPELKILPELARPVEIIIPRTKPDFDKMPFTIYNNEPPSYVPDEYRALYYRRIPVKEEGLGGVKTGDMFRPPDAAEDEEEKPPADKD